MIEGCHERIEAGRQTILIDANRGTVQILNGSTRTYSENAFDHLPANAHPNANLRFVPTGKTRTIAGFNCKVFVASSNTAESNQTITGCFSTSVPGWQEYRQFNRLLMLRAGRNAGNSGLPPGLPLFIVTTIEPHYRVSSGIPQSRRLEIERKLNNGPVQAIAEQVTAIKKVALKPSMFAVPSGYTQLQIAGPIEQ